MSLNNVPSKAEVMGWNPQSLADYMKRLKLPGCDKVVMKGSISGARFMQMTGCDLHVFPSLYVPIISKLHSEVSKGEQKRSFGITLKAQKYPKQVFEQAESIWNSDEFDNDSDNDYEGPDQEEEGGNYICAATEPQTAEQQDSDESHEDTFEPPSYSQTLKPPRPQRPASPQDCHSRDPVHVPIPAERTSKLPHPPPLRMNPTPQKPSRAEAHSDQPNLNIDRSKKPGQFSPAQKDLPKSKSSVVKFPGSFSRKLHPQMTHKPTDLSKKSTKCTSAPPVPTQPAKVSNPNPEPRKGLDPSWYAGNLTRHQAEAFLREVNKDGAFVVRDSSKCSAEHPYTLMLLKDGKVYNIKISYQGNSYSLGNGIRTTKSFPGVKEMITHHTHTPLLLIDATDQIPEKQSQSCLLHPAGL